MSLTSATIPNGLTSIGAGVFSECYSLAKIDIPKSVTSIGEKAFYKCGSLTELTIPSSVEYIGKGAFSECYHIDNMTISGNNAYIDESAFYLCTLLKRVTIGSGVETISKSAFRRCLNITEITVPDSVTTIGDFAFGDCEKLKSATISYNVTSMGKDVFAGTPDDLTVYGYSGSCAETYAKDNKIAFVKLTPPALPTPKFNASSATSDGVILAWDGVKDATSYIIYRAASAAGAKTKLKVVGNTTTSDATAAAGTTYYYFVQAYSSKTGGTSAFSAARAVKAGQSATAPATPKFNASSATSSGNILAWDGVKNATSYRLYRSDKATGERTLMKIVANTTTTDEKVIPGKSYYYFLTAYNGKTAEVSFFSAYRKVDSRQSKTAPGTPVITSAESASGTVTLKWDAVPNATSYRVYRSTTATGQRDLVKIVANTGTSFTVPEGKNYYYFLTAYNSKTEEVSFFSAYKTAVVKTEEMAEA